MCVLLWSETCAPERKGGLSAPWLHQNRSSFAMSSSESPAPSQAHLLGGGSSSDASSSESAGALPASRFRGISSSLAPASGVDEGRRAMLSMCWATPRPSGKACRMPAISFDQRPCRSHLADQPQRQAAGPCGTPELGRQPVAVRIRIGLPDDDRHQQQPGRQLQGTVFGTYRHGRCSVEMQKAGQDLVAATTGRQCLDHLGAAGLATKYNEWVAATMGRRRTGAAGRFTGGAEVALYELRQSIDNGFNGAMNGVPGCATWALRSIR